MYGSYRAMLTRCGNPNCGKYEYYGGRGITVCARWLGKDGFENFLADLGPRPRGKTLDRKDANGNYELSNCRWATKLTQGRNKRPRKGQPVQDMAAEMSEILGVQVPF